MRVVLLLVTLMVLPVAGAQGIQEALTECPGTMTGSTSPQQIHLQLTDNPSEMMVMWATEARGSAYVEWSHSGGSSDNEGESYCYEHDMAFHMALMSSLPLGEEITYRVGDGNTWSSDYTFTTINPQSQKFEWISIADHGESTEGQDVTDGIIADDTAQIVTISGDISYADGDQNVWDEWFEIQTPSMVSIPWVTAVGNHENEPGLGFTGYEHRFDMDGQKESEGFWYAREMPGVMMVFMSTEHPYDVGSEQHNWLEATLSDANLPENRAARPYLIVFGHSPMYSSNSYHGSEVELRDALEDLYVKHGVDLVLAGHDHFYERTWPVSNEQVQGESDIRTIKRGIAPIHLVIGMGGRSAYEELDEPQPVWSAYRENATYGWTKWTYDGNSRTLSMVHHRTDGTIGDFFTLTENLVDADEEGGFFGLPGFDILITFLAFAAAALRRGSIHE